MEKRSPIKRGRGERMRKMGAIRASGGEIERLQDALDWADAVVVGAGAGLSASAGLSYSGERFERYFGDFAAKYPIRDIYSGGFYPFASREEFWGWWSRHIWINRYMAAPRPVYERLLDAVGKKDYFVITTNVDHCFQRAGFDKGRLFYTQGDYGLFQCEKPCRQETYDNEPAIREMLLAQGLAIAEDGTLSAPKGAAPRLSVPTDLLPRCPRCGRPMIPNLRSDGTFVEDAGWHEHAGHYESFLRRHRNARALFLDLGTGMNTPGIVKFPFQRMACEWPDAVYACVNDGEAYAPEEIRERSVCVNGDIGEALSSLLAREGNAEKGKAK